MTCAIPGPPSPLCPLAMGARCWGWPPPYHQTGDACTSRPGELAELRAWEQRRAEERAEANRRLLRSLRG